MGFRWRAATSLGCFAALAAAEEPADTILVGGRVLTVDAGDRVVEALAIRDGRILAVGTTAEIERLAGPGTGRIDLAGRAATPANEARHSASPASYEVPHGIPGGIQPVSLRSRTPVTVLH